MASNHMKQIILLSTVVLLASLGCFAQNTTQKASKDSVKRVVELPSNQPKPLFILDDVELPGSDLGAVKPEDIESIHVIKLAKELEPYGEKGKNGVVIITTKKYKAKKAKVGP